MNIMRHAALLLLLLAAARLGDARQQPQSHLSTHPAATDARLPWELYTGCAKEPANPAVQVAAIRAKRQSEPTEEPTESEEEHEELEILMGDTLRNKHFYGGDLNAADISKAVAKRLDPTDSDYAIAARKKNKGELPNNFKPPKSFTLLLGDVPRGTELIFKPAGRDDQGNVRYQSEDTFRALEYSRNKKGVYEFQGETATKLELPEGFVENAEDTGDMRLNHFQSDDPNREFIDADAAQFDRNDMTEKLKHYRLMRDLRKNYNKPLKPANKPERSNPHSQPRGSSSERTKSAEDGSDFSDNHSRVRESSRSTSSCSSARSTYSRSSARSTSSRSSARSTPSCSSDDAPNRKRSFPENDREGDDANQEAKEANDANNDGVNDNGNGNDDNNEDDGNYERGD